jgi:hypothetical protein
MCEDATAAHLGQTRESDSQFLFVAYFVLVGLTLLQMIGCSAAAVGPEPGDSGDWSDPCCSGH